MTPGIYVRFTTLYHWTRDIYKLRKEAASLIAVASWWLGSDPCGKTWEVTTDCSFKLLMPQVPCCTRNSRVRASLRLL